MSIKGLIFDLDGTLVDSRLDFQRMRVDLGLPAGVPILEAIATVEDQAERFRKEIVVLWHEYLGGRDATLMPGVTELWQELRLRTLQRGIFTRNARSVAEYTLSRVGLDFEALIAREDAPPKPSPEGLHRICAEWNCRTDEVLFVGDYLFDLDAGRNAGIRTILYAPVPTDFVHDCTDVISHFHELWNFL